MAANLRDNRIGVCKMSFTETPSIAEVVSRVRSWPVAMRIELARRILETLENPPVEKSPPKRPCGPTSAEVAAMFKTDKPAPNDEECQRILEEELIRKYSK
jgi:hypothetical protein